MKWAVESVQFNSHSLDCSPCLRQVSRGPVPRWCDHLREDANLYILDTVVPPKIVTQMLLPSNAGFAGSFPTLKVLRVAPELAFNFVTVAPLKSVTQMLDPS